MTTALIWAPAVLGMTWGFVVFVRAWRWFPDQDDPSELRARDRGARLTLLPAVVLLAPAMLVSLSFLGWSSAPAGWTRFGGALPIPAFCALTGLGLVASLRTMAGRRASSWWLRAGLVPAVAGVASTLGA